MDDQTMSSPDANTVVITGSRGFLGGYVARQFASSGWRVVGVDRKDKRFGESSSTIPGEYHLIDLSGPDLARVVDETRPDLVIHAAGPSSVVGSVADPEKDFAGSAVLLFHLLDTLRRSNHDSRCIYLSSAAVYGNPVSLPIGEGDLIAPISPYGYHKWFGEQILTEFNQLYGIKNCAVRIFSAYGQGNRKQVIWDICRKVLFEPCVYLSGTGQETRDFIHVEDLARAVHLLAEKAPFAAEPYNLGEGRETSIHELANRVMKALGVEKQIIFSGEEREGDPTRWLSDLTRLRKLGFSPNISFEEGVSQYADWFRKEMPDNSLSPCF